MFLIASVLLVDWRTNNFVESCILTLATATNSVVNSIVGLFVTESGLIWISPVTGFALTSSTVASATSSDSTTAIVLLFCFLK